MTIRTVQEVVEVVDCETVIEDAKKVLLQEQSLDGSWLHGCEMGVMPDAQTAIFLYLLGQQDTAWTDGLLIRVLGMQRADGSFGSYENAKGDLSTTVECYYALMLYEAWNNYTDEMQRAEQFIMRNGGVRACRNLTKVLLAIGGEITWADLPAPSLYAWLFTTFSPVNLYDVVTFTRLHIASMVILADVQYVSPFSPKPMLQHLHSLQSKKRRKRRRHQYVPKWLITNCIQFLFSQREQDGTLAGYHSSTFLFLCSLSALGYPSSHPAIIQPIRALRKNFGFPFGDLNYHQQTCDAHVWNTALAVRVLRRVDVPENHPALQTAFCYLQKKQHVDSWDAFRRSLRNAGGWGFSSNNTCHPDTDDTVACLEALAASRASKSDSWQIGVQWLLQRQNRDGGWSAFDQNCDNKWMEYIPANDMKRAMSDPSTADITGSVIEFFLSHNILRESDKRIQRALRWLYHAQEQDGSWYGRWGTTYLYGTWCAVRALSAAGESGEKEHLQRAKRWLLHVQLQDGGFGESCASDELGRYDSLLIGQPSQTAWGLDTALSLYKAETNAIEKEKLAHICHHSAAWLKKHQHKGTWVETLPTGSAFPGALHIRYHIYPKVWPLYALSHYRDTF